MAHSNWHYQGFLKNIGVLDFAGGNVVHICSGASGLATVIVLGNRKGFKTDKYDPHNILLTYMGMSMLWVGWFGFNAGSAVGANFNAGYAMLATQVSKVWMEREYHHLFLFLCVFSLSVLGVYLYLCHFFSWIRFALPWLP